MAAPREGDCDKCMGCALGVHSPHTCFGLSFVMPLHIKKPLQVKVNRKLSVGTALIVDRKVFLSKSYANSVGSRRY